MPLPFSEFTIIGITFHLYGLVIGIAILVGYWLGWQQAKRHHVSESMWNTSAVVALIGGVVGARLYHGLTDWHLYAERPWQLLFVWQGGLSIIGAVMGGAIGLLILKKMFSTQLSLPLLLDCAVFGLPFAQAIGRLGNWINQELYGMPTALPWGIYIDPTHRIVGYMQYDFFHPLFLYEALATALFGSWLWMFFATKNRPSYGLFSHLQVGTGRVIEVYLFYYSIIRFFLDFLRINRMPINGINLGANQLVMAFVAAVITIRWMQVWAKK